MLDFTYHLLVASNSRSPIEPARQENDSSVSLLHSHAPEYVPVLNGIEGLLKCPIRFLNSTAAA
jgi:hypothetical protein